MPLNENVTQLLMDWSAGDETALDKLTPLIYEDLRRRAALYLQRERHAETLQATVLVHEAYLQVIHLQNIAWKNRAHFINMISLLMRRILVDHARRHRSAKNNFGTEIISLDDAGNNRIKPDLNLIALDEALKQFAKEYPRQAQVVELKFFGGLNTEEIAEVMQANDIKTSPRTVKRDWIFAKTWLFQAICEEETTNG